jgi:hypothetical protein
MGVPPVKDVNQLKVPDIVALAESVTVPDPQRASVPTVGAIPEIMEAVTGVRGVLGPQILPLSNVTKYRTDEFKEGVTKVVEVWGDKLCCTGTPPVETVNHLKMPGVELVAESVTEPTPQRWPGTTEETTESGLMVATMGMRLLTQLVKNGVKLT